MNKNFLKNRVTKNVGWLIGGRILQMMINLPVSLLTARYLGPSDYGIINYAAAYTAFFSSVCTLGINSVLVKELVDTPDKDGEIIGSSVLMRSLSGLLSALTIIGIVSVIDRDEPVTVLAVSLCSVSVLLNASELFNYWFQSQLKSKITSLASLAVCVITSSYKIVMMISGRSVVYFALASSVECLCMGVFLYPCYRKHNGGKLSCSISACKRILSHSCSYILPGLMVAVYNQTDKMMLKQMIGDAETGYYSTAVSICGMWCFVLTAVIDSFSPLILKAWNSGDEGKFEVLNRILYAIVFYVSAFVSLVLTVFAELIVGLLFGEDYLSAAVPLRIITWQTAFSYLGVARNSWIVSKNKQKYLIWIYVLAAAANVILNQVFIPVMGASGAALASLIAQITTVLIAPFLIKPLRRNSELIIEAIRLKNLR